LDSYPNALFIPCAAHSLNLVGVNAAERVLAAKLALGQIQNIFLYFHGSTSRWQVLESKLSLMLKGQSSTRWSSRSDSVKALSSQYWDVIEALIEITTSNTFNAESIAGAESLLAVMHSFKFLLSVNIWNEVLSKIEICNQTLQKQNQNLEFATKKLAALLSWLKEFKEIGFIKCGDAAAIYANEIGIDVNSGFEDKRRIRRSRKNRSDETEDNITTTYISNIEKFENEFFNQLMDNLIQEMDSRFARMKSCCDDFQFLWGKGLENFAEQEVENHVKDLCSKYENDFNQAKFVDEAKYIKHQVLTLLPQEIDLPNTGPLDILRIIYKHDLQSCYSNIATALQIFLTLPVTVASNERAFSKLKLIKTYLRSSMAQDRLSNLAILSIEYEITNSISFEETISAFANAKCRKVVI